MTRMNMTASPWNGTESLKDTMELIDPCLPEVMMHIISKTTGGKVSEIVHTVSNDNPLGLRPSEKDRYNLMIGRLLLDLYIGTGFDPTDENTLEMVRMPGKTKCCNPYSDNMYRHLVDTTIMEIEGDRFRFIFD